MLQYTSQNTLEQGCPVWEAQKSSDPINIVLYHKFHISGLRGWVNCEQEIWETCF